jgi:hypothetical protein
MNDDQITLRNLIINPPGKATRQVGARYMIREALLAKFHESIKNPEKRKKYNVKVYKEDYGYLLWIKVPSEKYDLIYDCIFELTFDEGVKSIMNATVKLYCNSPGWFMVVGYVANKIGILATGWEDALGRALTDRPVVTNPHEEYGFDKTTFRAIFYLTEVAGIVSISDLDASVTNESKPNPKDPKLSAGNKLFEYKRAKEKYTEKEKVEKKKETIKKVIERNLTKKETVKSKSNTAKQARSVKHVATRKKK